MVLILGMEQEDLRKLEADATKGKENDVLKVDIHSESGKRTVEDNREKEGVNLNSHESRGQLNAIKGKVQGIVFKEYISVIKGSEWWKWQGRGENIKFGGH